MGKKVYGKKGKSIHFPLFPYTFSPFFPMGKNGKTHIFPWAKMGLDPPPTYNTLQVKLKDALVTAAKFSKAKDADLAWIDAIIDQQLNNDNEQV